MREEYTSMKTQLEGAKQQIEVKNSKIEKLETDNAGLKQSIKDLKEKYANFDDIMKESDKIKDELRSQLKHQDKEIENLGLEIDKQLSIIQERDE